MEAINFEGVNTQMGKGQPQYRILPVQTTEISPAEVCPDCEDWLCDDCKGTGIIKPAWNEYRCRYELNDMELAQIIKTKSFFLIQSGFGFNPIFPSVEDINQVLLIDYLVAENMVECWVPLIDKTEAHLVAPDPLSMVELICTSYPNLQPENLGFRERKTLGVNVNGDIEEI